MNARLKTIFISSLTTIVAFLAVTYTSCNPDKCKAIVCAYGGTCDDGVCRCPSGYEDIHCETVSRDKFTGKWTVYEKGSMTNASEYGLIVEKDSAITRVIIRNFNNYFTLPVYADIVHDSIIINNQLLNGKTVLGVGYIVGDDYHQFASLKFRYKIIDSATQAINDYGYDTVDHSQPSLWNK